MATAALDRDRARARALALIPLGIALNVALGAGARALQLQIFLDAIGTIVVTLLVGLPAGIITGVASFLLAAVVIAPSYLYFIGTQAVIAVYVWVVARRGWLSSMPKVVACGIGLGIVAGTVSAPIIAYLFGGVTGSGPSFLTAYLLTTGRQLLKSVVLSGLAAEPIDKTIQLTLAIWLLRGASNKLLSQFPGPYLRKNNFVTDV